MPFIAPIVEGHGEVEAVPILLQRMARELDPTVRLRINPPIRVKSGSFINDEQYARRYIELAADKAARNQGSVLILLDCDDDCPAELGPKLLARACGVRGDIRHLIVLAYREFETWFIAAANSLRGEAGLPTDLTAPDYFEEIRNAKAWLGDRMEAGYDPVSHQYKLTRIIDLTQARRASSFARFQQRFASLLEG